MKINGKEIANKTLAELKEKIEKLKEKNLIPHLAVVLVGNNPSSVSYVNQKEIKGKKIGVKITVKNLPTNTTQSKLLSTIEQFNNDNNIYGIIVQRPLPKNINGNAVSLAIDPKKDIDGFHPNSQFQPPIALAALKILEEVYRFATPRMVAKASDLRLLRGGFREWLTSKKITVIGKGETGGKPIIGMFKRMGIEPKVIDSKTPNPQNITIEANIIISAVGKPNVVKPEMIKKNSILISIGLSKGKDGKLYGDYDEEKIKNTASFYTPTPGGVGPVNVAMLLENLVKATENQSSHRCHRNPPLTHPEGVIEIQSRRNPKRRNYLFKGLIFCS